MYIDIHTHTNQSTGAVAIVSKFQEFNDLDITHLYSLGLHPWHLSEHLNDENFQLLEKLSTLDNVVAIGECGLDKLCATAFDMQLAYFAKQVQLANSIGKPLLVHCVRAFNEVMQVLDANHNSAPVIFHGFNKGEKLALQLIRNGYYLSFGQALFQPRVASVFAQLPDSQLFLETDTSDCTIQELYQHAALIRKMELHEFKQKIQTNTKHIFSHIQFKL